MTDIKTVIEGWLESRYAVYTELGADLGMDFPEEYAVECMRDYSEDPKSIIDEYIDEVEHAFEADLDVDAGDDFVVAHRDEINQILIELYKKY